MKMLHHYVEISSEISIILHGKQCHLELLNVVVEYIEVFNDKIELHGENFHYAIVGKLHMRKDTDFDGTTFFSYNSTEKFAITFHAREERF